MNFPRLITFTKAREKSDLWENGEQRKKNFSRNSKVNISGEEAKTFYESLLSSEGEQSKKPSRKRRRVAAPSHEGTEGQYQNRPVMAAPGSTDEKNGYQLLKCSQHGDLKGVKRLLEKENCNVNFQDGYFWTAVMCAAYAGKKEVVSYLLKRGAAWVGVCETKGKDALALAEDAGHRDVVQLLQDSLRDHPPELPPRTPPPERKYCEVCKTHYQEDSIETHERSTVHLFNKKKKLPPTFYVIPEHNIGFKMMLKEGWDSEAGLGPSGAGRKFPVQTVLKRDQKGLGFQSSDKPKVTHFAANDTTAVARSAITHKRTQRVATVSKKEERRKEAKAKAWERDLRTYMNIDL
ncbi:G patch domain and ankyrin repeat-containing protein 1 [Hyla sarda]|uniref:G patch domain and ankyrin repeat-containing protein 1 n=1 Tax=Hyla sarda TaxID=327740 RepID=UPI0024C3E584|nr:G patch domain and ankyrin repeat-containing protein 1 [Hyla sarda]XP_056394187.1 G patch domain and ankyrin repeat-containing protein 1 [Hyla sarda]XP_056394188.1 G patch domain and ankyrin repeat-containing protein 1 [Hyla sarda]XP_056394189.1 G patch domain and ankyrin repeat-containing protein 1 [Hyla sarda]XP_056394190.1 G patch domain and ankyrin repeat-containing protein 1 [Hyla sarda]